MKADFANGRTTPVASVRLGTIQDDVRDADLALIRRGWSRMEKLPYRFGFAARLEIDGLLEDAEVVGGHLLCIGNREDGAARTGAVD